MKDFIFVLEMIGTVAFAFSGAMVAIEKKMDIFGVAALGMTTAVGGGIIRDVILGATPPAAFVNPVYALTAIGVSIVVFIPWVRKVLYANPKLEEIVLLLMDSLGLGIFTVVGIERSMEMVHGADNTIFLALFVGMLTGAGGGVLRDMFAGNTPSIFVKHFYASASIIGAGAYLICRYFVDQIAAMAVGVILVLVLRLLAVHFRWNLPVAKEVRAGRIRKKTSR